MKNADDPVGRKTSQNKSFTLTIHWSHFLTKKHCCCFCVSNKFTKNGKN